MSEPITEIHGPDRANGDGAAPPPNPEALTATPPEAGVPLALPEANPDDSPTIISRASRRTLVPDESIAAGLRGKKLAHFELLAPIGVGGMAAVIRARDTQLDRIVALKILPPQQTRDIESVRRFHQEARSAARLDHENIARVFFCGEDQGLHFIAFEFVEGDNLRMIMDRRGRLPVDEAIHYMLQIAAGMAHAAARAVVHRDVKPSNIIITLSGRAKLVDMGLARSLGPHSEEDVTQSGVTLGTFDYISPEQALEPRDADCRSDIYSLGCTFYHMLTGQPPVPEGTAAKKLHHHQHVPPPDPRQLNPDIPDEVAAVLARMMAKEPKERYQRPEHLVQHLLQIAKKLGCAPDVPEGMLFVDAPLPGPPRQRPILVGVIAVAVVVGLVVLLGALSGSSTPTDPGTTFKPPRRVDKTPDEVPIPPPDEIKKGGNNDKPPPPVKWEVARTSKELLQLCQKAVPRVKLAGDTVFELRAEDDAIDGPGLVFRGEELVIEPEDPKKRPTIALKYDPKIGRDQLWAALTLYGGKTTISGVRFQVDATDTETPMAALVQRDGGTLTARDCEFYQTGFARLAEQRHMRSVELPFTTGSNGPRASATFERCFFRGGDDALYVTGSANVQLVNCAFGPHQSLVHCRGGRTRARDTEINFDHCSAILEGGNAAFLLDFGASGKFFVNHCLISCPTSGAEIEADGAVLIKQTGDRPGDIHYESQHKNVFHNLIGFWVLESSKGNVPVASTLDEFKRQMEVRTSDRSIELLTNPWQHEKPIPLVDARPKQAFQVNLKLPELRPEKDSTRRVVGAEACAWGAMYEEPLPPVEDKKSDPVVRKTKIVDPRAMESGQGIYPSIDQAAREARAGDIILIRHNGSLGVDTVRLEKATTELTIKPYPRYRPVLTLGTTADTDAALVRLHDGKVTFEDLEFLLRPQRADFKAQSVVLLLGDGQCTFKNCVATLDPAKEVPLALVSLADPAGLMKMDPPMPRPMDPHVRLDNCFVRGEGDLVSVRSSRAFNLDVDDSLISLDGSLLMVEAATKEVPAKAHALVNLRQVTAVLGKHLVLLRREENRQALVPTQVANASSCLFHAARGKALIHLDGIDTEEQVKRFFSWGEGKGNTYSGFTQMLEQMPRGEAVMPLPSYDQDKWKTFTPGDLDRRFARVKFVAWPIAERTQAQTWPADFKVKEPEGLKCGATTDRLPRPAGVEPEPPTGDGGE